MRGVYRLVLQRLEGLGSHGCLIMLLRGTLPRCSQVTSLDNEGSAAAGPGAAAQGNQLESLFRRQQERQVQQHEQQPEQHAESQPGPSAGVGVADTSLRQPTQQAGSPAKRSPQPRAKQPSLEALLQRHATASAMEEEPAAHDRQQLVQQWQGMALDEVGDAVVLAAMPCCLGPPAASCNHTICAS